MNFLLAGQPLFVLDVAMDTVLTLFVDEGTSVTGDVVEVPVCRAGVAVAIVMDVLVAAVSDVPDVSGAALCIDSDMAVADSAVSLVPALEVTKISMVSMVVIAGSCPAVG